MHVQVTTMVLCTHIIVYVVWEILPPVNGDLIGPYRPPPPVFPATKIAQSF